MTRKIWLLLFLLFESALVHAGVIEYTDRTAWTAVAGSITNIGFEGIAPPGGFTHFDTAAGLTLSGVNFVGLGFTPGTYNSAVVSAPGQPYVSSWGSGDKLQAGSTEIDISLPGGVTAVGSDVMVTFTFFFPGTNSSYTATLSTGDVFSNIFSSGPPTRSFIGFTSTSPITSIKLVSGGTFAMIDNFAFNSASAVPEPGSLPLFVAGLLGIVPLLLARRKKNGPTSQPVRWLPQNPR